jgi:transcriptional regulator with XRE-family HTH domain
MTVMDGKELRSRRVALGMTQEALAKEFEVTANTVARWERGEVPRTGILPAWVDKVLRQIEIEKKRSIS